MLLTTWQIIVFASTDIYAVIESGWTNHTGLSNGAITNNSPAMRFGIGYLHDFNEMFGIGFEAGKGYYAKSNYRTNNNTKIDIKTSAVEFLFVATAHYRKIDLFVKIGGNRNTTNIEKSGGFSDEQCRIQPIVITGINYNFTSHFAATISYLHAFGSSIEDFSDKSWRCPGVNAVLGGVRVTFF